MKKILYLYFLFSLLFFGYADKINAKSAPHVFAVYNVENLLIQDLTAGRTLNHPITVQGKEGCDNVHFKNLHLIDAGEQFIKINNKEKEKCDNGIVEGCLIEYTDYPYWDGSKYYTQGVDKIGGGDNWIVRDCIIKNIRPHPEHLDAADGAGAPITFWQGGTNNLIERNIIINCRKGIELGIGNGEGVSNSIVRNNFVYREPGMAGGDIGISVNDSPDSKIYNNTVILNGTFDPGSGAKAIEYRFDNSTNLEIKNNLCDGEIWVRVNGLNPDISNNIYNADESWFLNAEGYDLHLNTSPEEAIDKGIELVDVSDDIDKQPRPVNGSCDIGADEVESEISSVQAMINRNFNFSIVSKSNSDLTLINYHLPYRGTVKIELFNYLGYKVSNLINQIQDAGYYSIEYLFSGFSNGIYLCLICYNNEYEIHKIIIN
ncbi:MAG: hypothetical protein HZB41_06675 [Ignavibacteriae bacterium]|nr:hypothetical protein [Ignavibacteriota bacterium]